MSLEVMCWPDPSGEGNPYLPLLYETVRGRGVNVIGGSTRSLWGQRGDVWHLHWPERYLNASSSARAIAGSMYLLASMAAAKQRGTTIVWTAHNLRAHDRRHAGAERMFWSAFTRLVDGTIFMSSASRTEAFERFPALAVKPSSVIPHGHYRDRYPSAPPAADARRLIALDPDDDVILCFGQVRPYKNIPGLVDAFKGMADGRARLLIAGACHDRELADRISAMAGADDRVSLRFGFVADEATPTYVGAATLMCLPYVEPLNSGAAILSLSFGVPCLMTDAPASRELQTRVGPEWLRLFGGPLTPRILQEALGWARQERSSRAPDLQWCDWQTLGEATIQFFTTIVEASAPVSLAAMRSGGHR